jgi:hypothetical protein
VLKSLSQLAFHRRHDQVPWSLAMFDCGLPITVMMEEASTGVAAVAKLQKLMIMNFLDTTTTGYGGKFATKVHRTPPKTSPSLASFLRNHRFLTLSLNTVRPRLQVLFPVKHGLQARP